MDEKLIKDFIDTVQNRTGVRLLPSEVEEHFARFLSPVETRDGTPEVSSDPATRMDLGWIMDDQEDLWYRQTDDTYRVRFDEGDWANSYRDYSREDVIEHYGFKGEGKW